MFHTSPPTDHPKKSRRLLPLLSGVLVMAVLASALVFSTTASSRAHAASAASTSCATRQSDSTLADGFGNVQIWLRMKTTWCWNHITVTSHKTILYWGITTLGKLVGYWQITGPSSSFNCYVAVGSNRGCSGNHEWAKQAFFLRPFPGYLETDLFINQWENYKGQFFSQASRRDCPGGC